MELRWAWMRGWIVASVPRKAWVHRCFDATLGYPGAGPRCQKLQLSDRPAANLSGPKVNVPGRLRRDVAHAAFEAYSQTPLEDLVLIGARDILM